VLNEKLLYAGRGHMMEFTDGRYHHCDKDCSLRKMKEIGRVPLYIISILPKQVVVHVVPYLY
jgi:hypothetical protein